MNQAAITHYGYSRAEFLQMRLVDICPPEDIPVLLEAFKRHPAGLPYVGVWQHRQKDGNRIDVEITAYTCPVNNQPTSLALIKDITALNRLETERQQIVTALRLSEKQRHLSLELTGTDIWDWDLTTGEVIWSANMTPLLGLTSSTAPLTYTTWRNCVHPEDLERLEAAVALHLQNQTLYSEEYRVVHPDGSLHWLLSKGQGVYDAAGQAVRMVGITLDISHRKQLELSLQASEAKLSRILDHAITVIVSFRVWDNRDWEYEYWSAGCEALYGFTIEELRADKTLWLSQVVPEDREAILMPLFKAFFAEQNTVAEYRFRHKDGSIRWISSTYASQKIAPNCWIVTSVNHDVSECKSLEQELLQINAELELRVGARTLELEQALQAVQVASRAKSTFLSNMSHELRTPLNAILGFSQLLIRNGDLAPAQKEQVDIINRSGEHLLNLINNILEMSNLDAEQTILTLNGLDLEQMLRQLAELFQVKASSKGLQLILQRDATVPQFIQVDENKLRRVLIHLLSNAINFTQTGSVVLQVQVAEQQANAAASSPASLRLHFSVQDTGPGIDPLEQDILFKPFVQTQTGRDAQVGMGLGLPISREFVHLMGGELCVISTLGQGATFYFQIPVVSVKTNDLPNPPLTRRVVGLAPDQPPCRVLVVEDHLENCQFLVQLLRSVGFEAEGAENGQVAVSRWQQWHPHLIWMDLRMPVLNGYAATQQIRRLEAAEEHTPIIALTAKTFERERARILAAGCDDLVYKPATAQTLFEKIAEHLGVRYIYEAKIKALEPKVSMEELSRLLLTALQTMPPEWIIQVQQAARILDEEVILQLLSQIPPAEVLLSQTLQDWVNEFQFDKLLDLIATAAPEVESVLESTGKS